MDRESSVSRQRPAWANDPAEARKYLIQHVRNCQIKECSTCSKLRDYIKRMNDKTRELVDAAWHGRAADVATLLNARPYRNVNAPTKDGLRLTALAAASMRGHAAVVTLLLTADADVDWARASDGVTPLIFACTGGHTEIVAKLLAANASVDRADDEGWTPMNLAVDQGHLDCVELLSSYGASRTWPHAHPNDTAEHLAEHQGHGDIFAWLSRSRSWSTALHHLELLTPESARTLLRAGADAYAGEDLTPAERARMLCASGEAIAGSAAHVVLEWCEPWSRKTHKFYPQAVHERVKELMLVGQWLKRRHQPYITIPFEVWEAEVVKSAVASERWGPVGDDEDDAIAHLGWR